MSDRAPGPAAMEIAEAIKAAFSVGTFHTVPGELFTTYTQASVEDLADLIEEKLWEIMPDGAR